MEHPSLALDAPFVDREKELATLKELFQQMLSGRGSTVFVVGEGGIGKTRIVREFRRYVESKGSVFLAGASYEEEEIAPYSPWIDVIRPMLKRMSPSDFQKMPGWIVGEVGGLVPDILSEAKEGGLKGWLQGPRTSSMITPSRDQDRIRLFQAITDLLSRAAGEGGIVVFLDDIGWADHASLQLFHYAARRVAQQRLMLIGAYRDVELPDEHPLARLTLDLNRQRIAHQISLNRFTHDYVSQLLTTDLNGPVSGEFSQLIYSRTGGNPFFVEEIVRSLIDEGLLQRSDKGWTVRDIQKVEIPTSVRAVIKQRISRLGEECTQFLSIASIIGMEFDSEVLKKVAGLPEDRSIRLLETALKAQLLRERREGDKILYIFADEQIRDFLGSQVSLLRRRKYHLAVGQAMEEVYKDEIENHLGELAYHFVEAAELSKAKEYSIKAGQRSGRVYAQSEAVRHYINALELVSENESDVKLELLTRLGQAAYSRADHKEVLRFCGEAIEIAERLGLKTRVAELYGLVGISYWSLGLSKKDALESILRGLKTLEDMEDTLQEAVLTQQIARVYAYTGEPGIGSNWVKKSIEVASKLGTHEVLAHAYLTLASTLPLKEKDSVFRYLEDALNLSLKHNLGDAACRAYLNLATIYSTVKGDYRRSIDVFLKGIDYAKKVGNLTYETWLQTQLTFYTYLPMGEWERCQRSALETIRIGRELAEVYVIFPLNALALIAVARGEHHEAKEFLNEAINLALKSEWPMFLVPSYQVAAAIHLAQDELDEAGQKLLTAFEYRTKVNAPWTPLLEVAFGLVTVSLKTGRLDKASAYYQELQQMASELDEPWGRAFEHWARGLIAEGQGGLEEAISRLKGCVELWKTVGRPYDLARAHVDLGRVLEKADIREEAEHNFNAAKKIFSQLRIPESIKS